MVCHCPQTMLDAQRTGESPLTGNPGRKAAWHRRYMRDAYPEDESAGCGGMSRWAARLNELYRVFDRSGSDGTMATLGVPLYRKWVPFLVRPPRDHRGGLSRNRAAPANRVRVEGAGQFTMDAPTVHCRLGDEEARKDDASVG